ncbi:MAG: DUF4864 domain-containing protein [Cyclobacteriaceae bacterium]
MKFLSTTKYIILLFVCFVIYATAFFMLGGSVHEDPHGLTKMDGKQARDMNLLLSHPIPHPELSPEQVVAIQLTALQQNDDATNEGIVITFNYASPHSKSWSGPLHRFVEQVQMPVYKPLFDYKGYIMDELTMDGNRAWQYVVLLDSHNDPSLYLFSLRRQRADPYADCWMTESIEKIDVERDVYYL